MAIERDLNVTSTTNTRLDSGKKNWKGKKQQKNNNKVLHDPTQTKVLTSYPPLVTEACNDEVNEDAIDYSAGEEWVVRVEFQRKVMDILGRRMNVADGKFKTF